MVTNWYLGQKAGSVVGDYALRALNPESYYAEKIEEQRKKKARKQTIAAVSTVIGVGLLGLVVAKRVF